jgi:hypothetical protein
MDLTKLADWVRENLFEANRGAFAEGGMIIAFGNGVAIPDWVCIAGFGKCSQDYTWVTVAKGGDVGQLDSFLWYGHSPRQREVARRVLANRPPLPEGLLSGGAGPKPPIAG